MLFSRNTLWALFSNKNFIEKSTLVTKRPNKINPVKKKGIIE